MSLFLYLGLRSTVILLHHILGVQVWNRLEGVKSHQGASSMSVKHLQPVPGLQTLKYYRNKEGRWSFQSKMYNLLYQTHLQMSLTAYF